MKKRHIRKPKPIHTNTLLDIVIPVMNRFDILEKCLSSIPSAADNITYNVILVDNGSVPEDANKFYASVQGATIIRNRTNEGFPRACNTGAARKQSPLIFFLNSDVILEPNAIKIAVTALDDDKIGVVGMKLLFPTEEQLADAKMNPNIRPARKIQHIGLYCNVHGEFLHTMIGWSEDNPRTFAIRDAYVVTGAALMTRRSIWNKVGGFNLAYGMGTYEDVDYCLSVRDLGYNIIVEQAAMGTHYTGATSEQHKIQFPLQYNRLVFLQRWAAKLNYTEHLAW